MEEDRARRENYLRGYRDGKVDRWLGRKSIIALTCPEYNLLGAAQGYYDGWHGKKKVLRGVIHGDKD